MKVLINVWTAVTLPVDSDAIIRLKNYIYSISFVRVDHRVQAAANGCFSG